MSSVSMEECDLLADSKYRSYISQVEKALRNFEATSEWADLISALGKLNKVLLSHQKYPVIPKRVTIGKRLAQCLHPALPSGVHLKALETYDIIFKTIGPFRLAQDLFIYSAGLFPLLSFAAMNVKPLLLSIYENHFTPLEKHLKPGLYGLLIGVLPGLEEGSEYYDRTNVLLENVCKVCDTTYFFGVLWECVVTCPVIRLPAITFVLSHFNKRMSMEDQLHIMGTNVDTLVSALQNGIEDTAVLVQRSTLDFVQVALPMHNKQLNKPDMTKLLESAISVLLRRDMSLNRRLFMWLLGLDPGGAPIVVPGLQKPVPDLQRSDSTSSSEADLFYFNTFAKDLLIDALSSILNHASSAGVIGAKLGSGPESLKPFRILISFLDRPEIGSSILEDILFEVFRCLYSECSPGARGEKVRSQQSKGVSKDSSDSGTLPFQARRRKFDKESGEVIKTANLLFGTFEPYFLWDFIASKFGQICDQAADGKEVYSYKTRLSVSEFCKLVDFLLDIVSLETYSETQTEYLPELMHQLIHSLATHINSLTNQELTDSLLLCAKILARVQPSMTPSTPSTPLDDSTLMFPYEQEGRLFSEDKTTTKDAIDMNEVKYEPPPVGGIGTIEGESDFKLTTPEETLSSGTAKTEFESEHNRGTVKTESSQVVHSVSTSSSSTTLTHPTVPQSVMQKCKSSFVDFLATMLTKRVLCGQKDLDEFMTALCDVTFGVPESGTKSSDYGTESTDEFYLPTDIDCDVECEGMTKVNLDQLDQSCVDTFTQACKLLVDFSCFPLYVTECHMIQEETKTDGDPALPSWLQALLTCCCFVTNFDLQEAAISAMLDMMSLTKSLIRQTEGLGAQDTIPKPSSQGHVSVVILPALTSSLFKFINERTCFYQVVSTNLWDSLSSHSPDHHQRSVEMLCQVFQLCPNPWTVEDIIGRALVSDDQVKRLAAHKKFAILWHLSRSLKVRSEAGQKTRTFDRSMFVMLDSLQLDIHPTQSVAHNWLCQSIDRGDIGRILEPILLMLLHPDTARISIQHVFVAKPKQVRLTSDEDDAAEAKIFAISSEGGNVIYHVSAKTISKRSVEQLRTMALTSVNDSGIRTIPTRVESDLAFDRVDSCNVNLHLNPFGSESSLDKIIFDGYEPPSKKYPDVENLRRLDKATCQREGIKFHSDVSDSESNVDECTLFVGSTELTSEAIVKSLVEEMIQSVIGIDESVDGICDDKVNLSQVKLSAPQTKVSDDDTSDSDHGDVLDDDAPEIHPLHAHLLLYSQKYDFRRTLYALRSLKAIVLCNPRLVIGAMSSTHLSKGQSPQLVHLQTLLARHRKSVFGKNFFSNVSDSLSNFRNSMYLEVLLSVCSYLIRSYYPNLMMSKLSDVELNGNREVQILAASVLTLLLSELANLVKDSARGFASFISDLLEKCKVQKAIVHCILARVVNQRRRDSPSGNFTEAIINFNEDNVLGRFDDTLLIKLLRTLSVIILLEDCVKKQKKDIQSPIHKAFPPGGPQLTYQHSLTTVRYLPNQPVVNQGMFLSAILTALKQQQCCHLHHHWVSLVVSALPYMDKALDSIVIPVVGQLCKNLESLAGLYQGETFTGHMPENVPPDHVITVLMGLTNICHFCLVENSHQVAISQSSQSLLASGHAEASAADSGRILSNLIHVFNPYINTSREASPVRDIPGYISPIIEARRGILSTLPRILLSLSAIWKASQKTDQSKEWFMGDIKTVRQFVLEFLSPLSRHHSVSLMGAVAVVWSERSRRPSGNKKSACVANDDQLLLVDLVSSIKVLPTDSLIQTVKHVIRQPPPTTLEKSSKRAPLEVSMLQFFYTFVDHCPPNQLVCSWPSLLALLKEGLQISLIPPGQFLLLRILNLFVNKASTLEDRKDQKDLQDITQKLLEACSTIAGSSLEPTTWLRKNLAVKPRVHGVLDGSVEDESYEGANGYPEQPVSTESKNINCQYSVQALNLLAEVIASLLDMIYGSDEKEKMVTFLTTSVMYNIFPYLKTHSLHNLASYRACSQILSSLSGYIYTRKAWKKEAFDLYLDPSFFQMDAVSLRAWRVVIDNLMTQDKTTFKDLMSRVALAPSGTSLNLFSNREAEFEQRAQLLKRLSFVIFCSNPDQFDKSLPDIQERLAESLRLPQVPVVQAQVFLCFRVLILRVSPKNLVALWPTIITEMVHVLLQIEQELTVDGDDPKSQIQRLTALDTSWVHGNGLSALTNPTWLQLYLAACKLLDLALVLSSEAPAQFQLYKWAFIGETRKDQGTKSDLPKFVPHCVRIAEMMNNKYGTHFHPITKPHSTLLITMTTISSLNELQPFFNAIVDAPHLNAPNSAMSRSVSGTDTLHRSTGTGSQSESFSSSKDYIEQIVEADFLVPINS